MQTFQPIVPLLDWQSAYIEDDSRFKFLVGCTQSGKSFATSLEYVLDAFQDKCKLAILLSASERQSVELMEKVKMHSAAMNATFDTGFFGMTEIIEHRAKYPNGCRIIALPANPDTARGYSGNVFLDEFGLHRFGDAIFAAMMGRATRGYKVRIASTFKGTANKFYALAKALGLHEGIRPPHQPVHANGWSGHWVDIHMCKEQGLKVDIEQIRKALDDDEIYLQEYCNVPMSGAETFIPLELVLACESGDAVVGRDGAAMPDQFAGMDIGRKKDLTVNWILRLLGDVLMTRGITWQDRRPFAEQLKVAREIAPAVQRYAIDSTGIGSMLAETMHKEFPHVEQVQFTAAIKERMAVELKKRFEERTIRIPESPRIRRACQAVKRFVGSTGVIRFDAARTDQGHADEFWALALANAAASGPRGYVPASEGAVVGKPVMSGMREMQF